VTVFVSTILRLADGASLAQLCSQLFGAYHDQHPGKIAEARLDAIESQ
jgi:hypothetical protein